MIQITVTLDETIITDAARRAVAAAYAGPSYNSALGAPGYEAIRAQVLEFVRSLDLRAEIATGRRLSIRELTRAGSPLP